MEPINLKILSHCVTHQFHLIHTQSNQQACLQNHPRLEQNDVRITVNPDLTRHYSKKILARATRDLSKVQHFLTFLLIYLTATFLSGPYCFIALF